MTAENGNNGHGHVFPRPDGMKARCGGPGMCSECSKDLVRKNAAPVPLTPEKTNVFVCEMHAGGLASGILAPPGFLSCIVCERAVLRNRIAELERENAEQRARGDQLNRELSAFLKSAGKQSHKEKVSDLVRGILDVANRLPKQEPYGKLFGYASAVIELERALSLANDANGTIEAALLDARRENAELRKQDEVHWKTRRALLKRLEAIERNDAIEDQYVRENDPNSSHEPLSGRNKQELYNIANSVALIPHSLGIVSNEYAAGVLREAVANLRNLADSIPNETRDLVQNRFSTRTLGGCPNCSQPIGSPHLSGCESKPSNTGAGQS